MSKLTANQRFLLDHPWCAFCGGTEPAVEPEHCPPRSFFQHRQWPVGFEFPICKSCNAETSDDDLLIAVLGRMNPFDDTFSADGRTPGLLKGVNTQFDKLLEEMMPSTTREARQINRSLGIRPPPGYLHRESGVLKIPRRVHVAVCSVGRKLAKGVFYKYSTGKAFPKDGTMLLSWYSNVELIRHGTYQALEILKSLPADAPEIYRSGRDLRNQFECAVTLRNTDLLLQARFGLGFALIVRGSTKPGYLEQLARDPIDREVAMVLQSSTLPIYSL